MSAGIFRDPRYHSQPAPGGQGLGSALLSARLALDRFAYVQQDLSSAA